VTGIFDEIIVLLETKLANPKEEVFVLQFSIGEFDMVVFDPAAFSCEIYGIRYSTAAVSQQYRQQKCELTRHRFGPITGMRKNICWVCDSNIIGMTKKSGE
jgi:hypothetical protein